MKTLERLRNGLVFCSRNITSCLGKDLENLYSTRKKDLDNAVVPLATTIMAYKAGRMAYCVSFNDWSVCRIVYACGVDSAGYL